MSVSIQDIIDSLLAQIDAIKGNVPNPAPCSISSLNDQIEDLEDQINDLRVQMAEEESPLDAVPLALLFGTNNVPYLYGSNSATASLILATGRQPAALEVDAVTISAADSANIIIRATGLTDITEAVSAGAVLGAFANSKNITVDLQSARNVRDSNTQKAEQYLELSTHQTEIINNFTG